MASASVGFKSPCSDMPSSPDMGYGSKKNICENNQEITTSKINNSKMLPFIIASILEVKKKHK